MPATGIAELPPIETFGATGDANVDVLLGGVRWAPDPGSDVTTLSFSFSNPDSVYHFDLITGYETGDDFNEPTFAMTELSASAQALFNSAVSNLGNFSLLDLVEVEDTATTAGTVRVAWSAITSEDAVAWAYFPSEWVGGGDIWLISANHEETDLDFQHTLLHELGHALGLKHSFEVEGAFPAIDSQYEGADYTVMSYTVSARFSDAQWADLWPQTYMYFDILALQYLYGVDTETTAGADTYAYDLAERYYLTVWDYGGEDTLGVNSGSTNVNINLTPGSWSNVGTTIEYWDGSSFSYDSNTVFITPDTIIENAYGAGGDDTLQGNNVANQLTGNEGNDSLLGGFGADTLDGGDGNDVLKGGPQADLLMGGEGTDDLYGGNGHDIVNGGGGSDTLSGGSGDDSLAGGGSGDRLFGDSGADTLNGGGGADRVDYLKSSDAILVDLETGESSGGFAEGDVLISITSLFGGTGDDTLRALESGSRLNGAGGDDLVIGRSGDDFLAGGNGNDLIQGGAGDDLMNGNRGDDTLIGGAGNDTLRGSVGADSFVFSADGGDDTVLDFRINDVLDLSATSTDFNSLADVQAAATEVEGGLLIDLGGDDSLMLAGLSLNDLPDITFIL